MENFRSKSCRGVRMQIENQNNNQPTNMQDLRSFSTSYAPSFMQVHPQPSSKDLKPSNIHKNSKKNRGANYGSLSNSNSLKGWSLSDPEIQRKKRVASYKVYAVEGKMKGSLRKSFRWIKHTCSQAVYGWW